MFSSDEDGNGDESEDEDDEVPLGESLDIEQDVTPDVPEAPSVKTFDRDGDLGNISDVDSETLRAFVVAVIYANAALLFVALGPMVWYFEGWSQIGAILFVAGLLAGVRTYQTYRSWKQSRDEATEVDSEGSAESETGATAESAETVKPGDATDLESDASTSGSDDAAPPEA